MEQKNQTRKFFMDKIENSIKKLYNSGAFHITIGSFFTKFVAFFGSIFVVRLLSKTDYGILQYVENLYSYSLVLAGLGLPFAILRYVVIAKENEKLSYMDYAVKHSLIRDSIVAILIIAINFFIRYPDNFQEARYYIPVLAVLLPFQDLFTNGTYSLRAFFKNKLYAFISCVVSALLILGRIIGAKTAGVSGVVWSRLIINAICAVVLIIYVYKLFPKADVRISNETKKEINSYSFQYMITNGLWVIFMLNDSLILGLLTNDPTIVADFKVAYVLPGNLSLISTAIGIFVAPYFTRNENNYDWVRHNYKLTSLVNAAGVGIIALPLVLFASPIISFVYGKEYLNVVPLMQTLLIGAFINSGFRYVTANILSAMGKVKSNLVISTIGLLLQIGIDVLFIPKYGAMGVAYSNCLVFSIMAIALFCVFFKTYYRKID